jgi:hypothetical protein
MDYPTWRNGPDKRVPPRDGSVCKRIRRGVLVTPDELGWIIQPCATDLTSRSLRGMEASTNEFGGACLSRPMNWGGSSNLAQRTRQAGPSEGWKRLQTNSEGHACRARRTGMDYPTWRNGPDKQVPPRGGPDKRVPPRGGPDKQVPTGGLYRCCRDESRLVPLE